MEELIILRTIWVLFALMSLSWSEVRTLPSMVLLDSHSPNPYMNYPLVTLATWRMLFAMFPSTDYFSSGRTRLSRNCLSFSGAYIFRRDSFLANISGHSFRNVSLEISPALYLFIPMFMLSEEEPSRDSAMPERLESGSESLHADFNLLSGTGIRLMECL